MKILKIIGWIVIPYIMVLLMWKRLNRPVRVLAVTWSVFALLIGIGAASGDSGTNEKAISKPAAEIPSSPTLASASAPPSQVDKKKQEAADEAKKQQEKKKQEEDKAAALAKLKKQQEADIKAKAEAEMNDPELFGGKVASKHFDSAEVQFDKDSGHLSITAPGSDNLTNNLIKKGMWMDATATLKDLKDVAAIKSVDFSITFPMVDKFGNESQSMVMKIALSEETISKINWDNFINSNLPNIADVYWEHPAFS